MATQSDMALDDDECGDLDAVLEMALDEAMRLRGNRKFEAEALIKRRIQSLVDKR